MASFVFFYINGQKIKMFSYIKDSDYFLRHFSQIESMKRLTFELETCKCASHHWMVSFLYRLEEQVEHGKLLIERTFA